MVVVFLFYLFYYFIIRMQKKKINAISVHSEFGYFALSLPPPLELCPLTFDPTGGCHWSPTFQDSDFHPVAPMEVVSVEITW